jgi:nicotinamidase-related amidase
MGIALVVVDMQRAFFGPTRRGEPELSSVLEYVNHAVDLFRSAGAPVVWVHDIESHAPGSDGYALVEGLDALYHREGFIELSTTADLVRVDGRPLSDVHMVRWVGE